MNKDEEENPCSCCGAEEAIDRRTVVTGATAFAVGTSIFGTEAIASSDSPENLTVQEGDRIQLIKGSNKGQMLKPELLEFGEKQIEAFPYDVSGDVLRRKNRLNRLLVIRLNPDEMDDETRERSVEGVLAFSAICTHRGCTIKSWMPEDRYLRCHCHLSVFDALSGGSVKSGPARRELPMVPLGLDAEGYIVAQSSFTKSPGASKK